jgi:hypothetical protein
MTTTLRILAIVMNLNALFAAFLFLYWGFMGEWHHAVVAVICAVLSRMNATLMEMFLEGPYGA